jgi:hypothetical protein
LEPPVPPVVLEPVLVEPVEVELLELSDDELELVSDLLSVLVSVDFDSGLLEL